MLIDYEAEYNNGSRVKEAPTITAGWAEASQALRASVRADFNVPYGPDPQQRYDLFMPPGADGRSPIAVFIHGGYWQWRDRKDFSFTAAGALAHGVAWAMPSYRLCPTVRISDIIADMQAFLVHLWQRTGQRPVVTGHSAGGHLTAAMLATDWSQFAGVPIDLVRMGYAISGVFEVAPLVGTSIGVALNETAASAMAISPRFGPVPRGKRWLTAAVGAIESPEFIRQSVDMAGAWSAAGLGAEAVIVPATNHYTVIDDLARSGSAMSLRIAAMARACGGL
jgi:arylformamidase